MAHSLRAEAIRLYRDIFRVTRVFRGLKGGDGADTAEVLRRSARMEFDDARRITDPEEIMRRLVVGRDCLSQLQHKLAEARENPPPPQPAGPHSRPASAAGPGR